MMKEAIYIINGVTPNSIIVQEEDRLIWVDELPNQGITVTSETVQSDLKSWDVVRRAKSIDYVKETQLSTWSDVYQLWYSTKFLCQEIDDAKARNLGRFLASQENNHFEMVREQIVDILYCGSTPARIKGWFHKAMAHERKQNPKIELFQTVTEDASEEGVYQGICKLEAYAQDHHYFFQLEPYTKREAI
ncbi:hypothetical protein PT197_02340 [Erysipelothrix rhusiopathiae]|uniref:hypothetical protein n=1 Tax=Erysipelothrix rhusiopathiae TaxID=1648 RepID=UPI001EDCAEB7|nr:hypothetical protein [Erysipelothrix rhusiopathiae]MCG4436805.1 hypothetical protein [Erysipelothrix rhusiopathiae]MCG4456512.1 hypothetical protein [Erysipelothrix rhusiopathiae]MDE8032864.1 hypothetical protein [Erysipelothrix rhusiopathiae]MDE8036314.1 hypothetical protein [Erysipelothrix rhusiopathiae]MDE8037928.1 hypothetical protein [Erysipelothrix rhusiopathiae]